MKRAHLKFCMASAFAVALGAFAGTASAQGTPQVAVNDFQLVGAGCPAKTSTMVTVTNGTPGTLSIKFPQGGFKVSGPAAMSQCAIMMNVTVTGFPKVEFNVARGVANVQVANPENQGQLSVTSRFRVQTRLSAPRTASVSATTPAAQMLTLNPINVQAEIIGTGTVMADLQLQTMGAGAGASLSLDSIDYILSVTPDVAG